MPLTDLAFKSLTILQNHWLSVFHADYRKLKNQARFIKEINDGELVVSRKKKSVLVQELRDRKYEAFPPGAEKDKSSEEKMDDSDPEDDATEPGSARDFDYLLGVSSTNPSLRSRAVFANSFVDGNLVTDHGASRKAQDCHRQQEG